MSGEPEPRVIDKAGLKSLPKLAQKNFIKFAFAVQHLSAEAQIKVIEQIPEFRKLAEEATKSISKSFKIATKANTHGDKEVHAAYRHYAEVLARLLDKPELTIDDQLKIAALIRDAADAQAAKDSESKRHVAAMFGKVLVGSVVVVGMIVAAASNARFGMDSKNGDQA